MEVQKLPVPCQRCKAMGARDFDSCGKQAKYCDKCLGEFNARVYSLARRTLEGEYGMAIGKVIKGDAMFTDDPDSPPYAVTLSADLLKAWKLMP